MKIAGIIAEYNPFHNGHSYLINKARELCGADYIIVVMSGNYVQRGEPAVFDKYTRAECALKNGADVVIELPVIFSTASAEVFAAGAVSILNSLGVTDNICFGSECGDIKMLSETTQLLSSLSEAEKDALRNLIKSGMSYPAAVTKLLVQQSVRDVLTMPNNTLAIEYIKSLKMLQSDIIPVTINRHKSSYNDLSADSPFSSAASIRKHIRENKNENRISDIIHEIRHTMPDKCIETLICRNALSILPDDFSQILGSRLIGTSYDDLARAYDISTDLANKIYKNIINYTNIKDFTILLKSKDLTYNYIARALMHFILNINDGIIDAIREINFKTYARLLGFKKNTPVLSKIKANTDIPVISKFADSYAGFTGINREILDINLNGDHLYRMIAMNKYKCMLPNEFQSNIIVIPEV